MGAPEINWTSEALNIQGNDLDREGFVHTIHKKGW